MCASDLEKDILTVLTYSCAGEPVKARTIAHLLGEQFGIRFDKRQINPILYRMRAAGKVTRDEYFRWSLKDDPIGLRSLNTQEPPLIPPANEAASVAALASRSAVAPPIMSSTNAVSRVNSQPQEKAFKTERYGPFEVTNEARPNARHCRWCSNQIAAKLSTLTVRREGKVMFFCGVDCWRNWESIYWQRVALKRLHLSGPDFHQEQRRITRQKHFLGYRPDLFVRNSDL